MAVAITNPPSQDEIEAVTPDPVESAREAGLRYVHDSMPGIRRVATRNGSFRYIDAKGQEVTDPDERLRIKALGIPPAWTDVWICANKRGHLQATGRDARGRKQYRYHEKYRQVRDEAKYERMLAFAQFLPAIRQRVEEDLRKTGLPREKVLATLIKLLEGTLIRVGNDEYARSNESYGLTTLRDEHARFRGEEVRFTFRGKSGKDHSISLHDRRLARIVKQCRDIPGERLFQYKGDDGEYHGVYSEDVNAYLREITGHDFSAKDFRTWAGTVLAAQALREFEAFDSKAQAKKNVVRAIEAVAARLGNTKAICRKCYVHPAVIDAYLDGAMLEGLRHRAEDELTNHLGELPPEEAAVLAFLRRRLSQN
ncbi:MAG: DNA topoisomerase IB [Chloroflexi bacterium]|nr:DNA topoisomerase IB [Chloroflexota bacterium]